MRHMVSITENNTIKHNNKEYTLQQIGVALNEYQKRKARAIKYAKKRTVSKKQLKK